MISRGLHGDAFDIARLQPLAGEIAREIFRARVGQHALHLRGQLLAQFTARRQVQQLVVRHRRPQEIGEARGKRVFVDLGDLRIQRVGRGRFEFEQEARRRQHRRHGMRHALFERLARFAVVSFGKVREPLRRVIAILRRQRPAIGLLRKRGQQFLGIGVTLLGAIRVPGAGNSGRSFRS